MLHRSRLFVLGVAVALTSATSGHAATVQFAASLDGAQETPPVVSPGAGTATLVMDTAADTLTGTVVFAGLSAAEVMAHIHGFSAPGVASGVIFGLPLGSPKPVAWNYAAAQEANIIAGLTYVNVHTTAFLGGEIRGQILRVPSCGDGILDGGEACDDGNVVAGDCCSPTCTFEPATTPCPDDGDPCTLDECDGAGVCGVGAPRSGCRTALKSSLSLKDDGDDTKDKMIWKWLKGQATTQGEFGLPTGTTNYTLCLYAGTTSAAIGSAAIPPGSAWQAISDKGYKFKDPTGLPDGVTKAILKGGAAGKAKALVKGKGAGLPDVLGAALPLPVVAQLVNDDSTVCFEGQYDLPDVIKNEAAQFKAKAQ